MEIDANHISSMSTQINAERALDLARGFLDKAMYAYYFIVEDGMNWINRVDVKISQKGELLGLTTIDQ